MRIAFEINPGIVSDETTYATPGYWSDGNNIRYWRGKAQPVGGWKSYFNPLGGVCRTVRAWIDNLGQKNIAFGTQAHLYVIKSDLFYDITPSGLDDGRTDTEYFDGGYGSGGYGMGGYGVGQTIAPARTWSLANRGETLMANPSEGAIYWWQNDPGIPAEVLPGAPTSVNRMTVAPNNQVIAFGCDQVDGIYNAMVIRGSAIADPTDWTPSSSSTSFEAPPLPGGGMIVDGQPFGDGLIVWTNESLFIGTYIGSGGQDWRFDRVASGCGLAAPQAAIVVNQAAYWLTPDMQIYAFQYGGSPTPLTFPLSREFQENIDRDQLEKVVICQIGRFGEIWLFYPDKRDGNENSRFVMVNAGDPALPWSKGDIARTAAIDSGVLDYPLMVGVNGQPYLHENGSDADGDMLEAFVQSSPQYVGQGERMVMLRGIWPDFEAQESDISLSVLVRQYPQGTDKAKGPWTLAPGREKRDFMAQGRLVSIRLESSAVGSFWRLGKPSFDAVLTGER